MSERSRRSFLASLVVPFALSATVACQKATPAEEVADRFMDFYYVRLSVKDAVALSSDLAREKLDRQLQLVDEAGGPESSQGKPQVIFKRISQKEESPDSYAYVYEVDSNAPDLGKRLVFLKLRQEEGQWKVTLFTEDDAPPDQGAN